MKEDCYFYNKGNEEFEAGNINDAIKSYLKSLEFSTHFKTYEKLYQCYKDLGEDDLANYFIRIAYESNKKMIRFHSFTPNA